MTWIRLDDGFPDHPKILALPVITRWALVTAICYCGRFNTDGFLPRDVLDPRDVKRLIVMGLLDDVDGTLHIHDFLDYNPSREQVENERASSRERMAKSRRNRAYSSAEVTPQQPAQPPPQLPPKFTRPDPTRPDPYPDPDPKTANLAPRERDALFETVAEVCGVDWHGLTDTGRGVLNRSVAQLRPLSPSPDEIRRRAANWPYEVPLTPAGLAKHWASLSTAPPVRVKKSTRAGLARAEQLEQEGR